MAHSRHLGHALDQVDPGDLGTTQHVALAGESTFGGAHVAACHVAHVDDVGMAVDDGRQPPAKVIADGAG